MRVSDAQGTTIISDPVDAGQPVQTAVAKAGNDNGVTSGQALRTLIGVPTPAQVAASKPETVDQDTIYQLERSINGDARMLAMTLQGGGLSQAEQNALIRALIHSDNARNNIAFYHELQEVAPEHTKVIADALNDAYTSGTISKDDLLRLADFNGLGNGAQRLVSLLDESAAATKPGGAVEGLGQALLQRANGNPGTDRSTRDLYGAAVAFAQGEQIYVRNQGTNADRIAMFEATVEVNEAGFSGIDKQYQSWKEEGLATASRLFIDNVEMLTDNYGNPPANTGVMARFFAQTSFNIEAQSIPLGGGSTVAIGINDALSRVSDAFVQRAETASSPLQRERAVQALGALAASVAGGAAVSLTNYSEEIRNNEAFRDEMAGLFSSAIKPLTRQLTKRLPDLVDTLAQKGLKNVGVSVLEQFIKDPARPDTSGVRLIIDTLEAVVSELENTHNYSGLLGTFQGARAAETSDLETELNVNLGGHRD